VRAAKFLFFILCFSQNVESVIRVIVSSMRVNLQEVGLSAAAVAKKAAQIAEGTCPDFEVEKRDEVVLAAASQAVTTLLTGVSPHVAAGCAKAAFCLILQKTSPRDCILIAGETAAESWLKAEGRSQNLEECSALAGETAFEVSLLFPWLGKVDTLVAIGLAAAKASEIATRSKKDAEMSAAKAIFKTNMEGVVVDEKYKAC